MATEPALAWIVGFEKAPGLDASQISDEVIESMFFDFLPAWDGNAADFSASARLRPTSEVMYMEYKFYCAHNAVRSAQMGGATVPAGFDSVAHGGAVHERRHALTWALAQDDDWDDTDLSTCRVRNRFRTQPASKCMARRRAFDLDQVAPGDGGFGLSGLDLAVLARQPAFLRIALLTEDCHGMHIKKTLAPR
jgi:hypothetical protein